MTTPGGTRARLGRSTDGLSDPTHLDEAVASGDDPPERPRPPGAESRIFDWLQRNLVLLIAGGAAGLILSLWLPIDAPRYVAQALVAPSQALTQAQFEPSITTVNAPTSRAPERRQALADLVTSGAVEMDAIRRLKQAEPRAAYRPGDLVPHVLGSLLPRSEVIAITASSDTPAEATLIANAWANSYVDFVNRVYALDQGPSLDTLRQQLEQAAGARDTTQQAVEANLRQNQLEAMTAMILARQAELALLEPSRPADRPSDNDYRLVGSRTVDEIAQTLRRIDDARQGARLLLAQMTGASLGPADEAALAVLKTQVVAIAGSGNLPSNLQLVLPTDGGRTDRAQLEALVANLDTARQQVATTLEVRRRAYEAQTAARIAALNDELRMLRSEQEAALAERTTLMAQRDLALSTYTALAKKVEEQEVQSATAGHIVELASSANEAVPFQRVSIAWTSLAVTAGAALAVLFGLLMRALATLVGISATGGMPPRPVGRLSD